MANQKVVTNFNNLYDQMYAKFRPSYTPQSASTLKDTLSRAMRPSYDKQIKQRQDAAAANRAAIDADAASRGVGSSTYVTDVKNRNRNAEAADVQGIESDYNAALYSALLNRMNAQDEMSLTAENQARGNALGAANALFGLYNKTTGGGGGGGWGRRGSKDTTGEEPPDDTEGFGDNVVDRVAQAQQGRQDAINKSLAAAKKKKMSTGGFSMGGARPTNALMKM